MDDSSLIKLRDEARNMLTRKEGNTETIKHVVDKRVKGIWRRRLGDILLMSLPGSVLLLSFVIYFIYYLACLKKQSSINVRSGTLKLCKLEPRKVLYITFSISTAILIPGIVTIIMVYIFYPNFLRRTNIIEDIKTFAYGYSQEIDGKSVKVEKARLKDLAVNEANLKLGFLRTFTIDTTINLDNAMANMREAIGYSVVRDEDMIDTMALIEDIIVPRILASNKGVRVTVPEFSDTKTREKCEENIEFAKECLIDDPDNTDSSVFNDFWQGTCKPGMISECSKMSKDDDMFGLMQCQSKMDMDKRFESFMWKPDVEPIIRGSEEECFSACDAKDGCKAAVFNSGKCYIIKNNDVKWEVDTTNSGSGFYNKDGITIPDYDVGNVVDDIVADIQVISPLMDLSEFEEDIKKRLREADPDYEYYMEGYDSIITALIKESVVRADDRTGIQDGGNFKADMLVTEEYLSGTTVSKFNKDIAWPVIKAAVNVAARNKLFQAIADRRKKIFDFYHIMFMFLFVVFTAACLIYMAVKVFKNFRDVVKNVYPIVPIIVLIIVFLSSIITLLIRRRARFRNNIQQQSDNATSFVSAITELSNVFSNDEFKKDEIYRSSVPIDIPANLQDAVLNENINAVSFKHGTSKKMVSEVYKSKERENLIRKMAAVLDEYDKCNNIMYRGGIPFPTALVTAYIGLLAIGIGVLFSVPGIGPTKVVRDIEYAEALAIKANAALNDIPSSVEPGKQDITRNAYDSYMQQLCDLWKESYEDSGKLKSMLQYTAALLSSIFGVVYIAKTSEDASNFAKATGSGIHGIVGDCV